MNTLTEKTREILLVELNKEIESIAVERTNAILNDPVDNLLAYPPNCGLTKDEAIALDALRNIPNVKSLLRKLSADSASASIFRFLNFIDETGDPDNDDWNGVDLVEGQHLDQHYEFLHDEFFEAYWTWRKIRPEKTWRLDTYDGPVA